MSSNSSLVFIPPRMLFMALSINLLTDPSAVTANPAHITPIDTFAWRFPGVIIAAATTFLLILFGKNLFNSERVGFIAAFLYTFDGMTFAMARVAMNDVYLTFFVLLSAYIALMTIKNRSYTLPNFVLLGISLGLAVSTKWSAFLMYGFLLALFTLLIPQRFSLKSLGKLLVLALLPLVIYILSYSQWWLAGLTPRTFFSLIQESVRYQFGTTQTHDYSSPAWTWPVMWRPVYLYLGDFPGTSSKIYAMGNPLVWLPGVAFVVAAIFLSIKTKNRLLLFLTMFYFVMFIPWVLSPRIMFLYHYLPSAAFLMLISGYVLSTIFTKSRLLRNTVLIYLAAVVIAFVYFYPHWSALGINPSWDETYYWLNSWR